MTLPSVSCLCPTYGRYPDHSHLLAEAVESFLRQDYRGEKELLVLNDAPGQTLVCHTPGVRVVNLPYRVASLGAKYNLTVSLARGDVLLPWEDDDLALPHRISQAVRHLAGASYWNPQRLWYWEAEREPREDHGGVCHNASAYTRAAWEAAGGYPAASGNQDALFDRRLRAAAVAPPLPPGERPAYVYRWGVSPNHLSGNADHERAYREWGARPVAPGTFTVRPAWHADYEGLCRDHG